MIFNLNEKVEHKSWGEGTIIQFDGEIITIQFRNVGEKRIAFPIAFDKGFIKLLDDKRQALLEEQIKEKKLKKENTSKINHKVQGKNVESNIKSRSNNKTKQGNNSKDRQDNQTMISIDDLKPGHIYTNQELHQAFKISTQGGMRKSNTTNSLVLFSNQNENKERNPYKDTWHDDGYFHYTGMGLHGDQSLKYMQNKTLSESNKNGVSVYLFESYMKNEYTYRGKVALASTPYAVKEKDSDKKVRRVYKFPLKIVD